MSPILLSLFVICAIASEEVCSASETLEDMVRNDLFKSQTLIRDEAAGAAIPNYSRSEAELKGDEIASKSDAELKAEADQKIVSSKQETTGEGIISTAMEKQPLNGFEEHEMFKRADKIWSDPVSAMNDFSDCKEKVNNTKNQYTKRTTKETKFDEVIEEKICEKPAGNVVCEKVLNVSCESSAECGFDSGGIEEGEIASDMNFVYNYPYLTIGTISGNYWSGHCAEYFRRTEVKIKDIKNIKEFRIVEIGYDDYLQIKVNGIQVYNGPYGGDKLEVIESQRINAWFVNKFVDTGASKRGCELMTDWHFNVDIDLKPYLKEGVNVIDMKVVVSGYGEGWMRIKASQACCTKFKEMWEKRCWLE